MIWAVLIVIGIPLWLIAVVLILLVRTRTKVRQGLPRVWLTPDL